jgi:hypothetical protein
MNDDVRKRFHLYLQDHLAAAVGGVELAGRASRTEADTDFGPPLHALQRDIEQDAVQLRELVEALGATPKIPLKEGAVWLAEKLARLKLNDRVATRSPLGRLYELEGLQTAVTGKRGLWQSLLETIPAEPRLAHFDLRGLLERADEQRARVAELHDRAARLAFGVDLQGS